MRRIAGLAALAYVAGVGIENMEVLDAPTLGSPVADIRSAYADQAFSVVTSFAGILALLFYTVFAVTLYELVRKRDGRREPWALVGLAGGIAGPVLAAMGAAANAVLVARSGTGLSDDTARTLFELHLIAQMIAGVFIALFLVGMSIAALRARVLPAWLAWSGCALGAVLAFTPLAALTQEQALEVAVTLGFALDTLWIFVAGLFLALAGAPSYAVFIRRAAFLVLVIAAALVGIGLLAAPGATGKFFAWGLGPEPMAAFAGGVYVGAAALYGAALPQPWRPVRGLVAGAAVLSVSVLVVTLVHLEEFDLDRLQASMWLFLFGSFASIMIAILVTGRSEGDEPQRVRLPAWARVALGAVAALLGALAVALWIDPTGLSDESPFSLSPLGGRFAGCWVALMAVVTGWAALHDDVEEARLPALGLVLLPVGGLVAALRTISDLEADAAATYIAVLVALIAVGVAILAATGQLSELRIRSTASARRSSGTVSEMRKKPSPLGP